MATPDSAGRLHGQETPDLVVIHEHPEWQKPLFAALARRGVAFEPFDVTRAPFGNEDAPRAPLYFNQASPSAYLRGDVQATLLRTLDIDTPPSITFNDVQALQVPT